MLRYPSRLPNKLYVKREVFIMWTNLASVNFVALIKRIIETYHSKVWNIIYKGKKVFTFGGLIYICFYKSSLVVIVWIDLAPINFAPLVQKFRENVHS